jgi:hypothetical protein
MLVVFLTIFAVVAAFIAYRAHETSQEHERRWNELPR